jgi:hypothetical protein
VICGVLFLFNDCFFKILNGELNDYMSAGSLSRYILWNKKPLRESIADYKRRFNLE